MSDENKSLIHRWFAEVWNSGNTDSIGDMLLDDAVIHGLNDPSGNAVTGIDAFRAFHAQFRKAFPDILVNVEDVIAEGDKVVARCSVQAKHTGESLGIAATNSSVDFTGIAIVRVCDGKIAEAWNNFDFLKMNQQLGIL
ncbi:MAG TPA: ester cyclase [Pyrinomonadaceae bacterium]|jgi:hypothetical protein|nr:ester cyclase [Pyrinomonadaceae bacterium]